MKDDIKPPRTKLIEQSRGTDMEKITVEFYVPEANALRKYTLIRRQHNGKQSHRSSLVDGLQMLPGFRKILKQETTKYAKNKEREDRSSQAIRQEFERPA